MNRNILVAPLAPQLEEAWRTPLADELVEPELDEPELDELLDLAVEEGFTSSLGDVGSGAALVTL